MTSPECRNLSPEQAVAKTADSGRYVASESTIRRVMKAEKLDAYRERSKPATAQKPRALAATAPLTVLSWDITFMRHALVRGGYFYLYLFIDVWSRKIVGAEVHETQSAELAAAALRSVCTEHGIAAETATLHADNGAPMKGATMLATMQALGIAKSFSRPGVSDDNPFVESLFRTLKYAPTYPSKGFPSLAEARSWVQYFVRWYNEEHLHSGIGWVTPEQRHCGADAALLAGRRRVYETAREANARRWTRAIRDWSRPSLVALNPDRIVETRRVAEAA